MRTTHPVSESLSADAQDRLDRIVERFETAWRNGDRPAIEDYLPADSAERLPTLIELVHIELERRLKAGETVRVEGYLTRYPELSKDSSNSLKLIAAEYAVRRRKGEEPEITEYIQRFPHYASQLKTSLSGNSDSTLIGQGGRTATAPSLAKSDSRYRILHLHAQGGLGQVFVAFDTTLHREVALKKIKPERECDRESRRRFLQEAEIASRLEHPGIVPVHDLVVDDAGQPAYTMRFIQGDTLKEAIERFHKADLPDRDPGERSLALRELLGRFVAVCNTVAYAHSRGVLHRDIKPANILLGKYGETLLVDWGLAKPFDRSEDARASGEETLAPTTASAEAPTLTGQAIGTPAYIAPEQAAGRWRDVGPASDLYSLGATLYCLLAGRPPFIESNIQLLLSQVQLGEFAAPRQVKPQVPRELQAICLEAMALKPSARYATPLALAEDIEHWLADEAVSAYREPLSARLRRRLRRHRTLTAVTAAFLASGLLAVFALGLIVNRERQQTREADQLAKLKAGRLLTATMSLERGMALADHGEIGQAMVCLASGLSEVPDDAGNLEDTIRRNLAGYCRSIHPLKGLVATPGTLLNTMALAPDGDVVLVGAHDGGATFWRLSTGRQFGPRLQHHGPILAVAFDPSGKTAATAGADGTARVWDRATGQPVSAPLSHEDKIWSIAFDKTGKTLITASADKKAVLWDFSTSRARATLRHNDEVRVAVFDANGQYVLTGSGDKTIRLWDASTGKSIGEPLNHETRVHAAAISPNGRTIIVGCEDGAVYIWDRVTGKLLNKMLKHAGIVQAMAFAPNGKVFISAGLDRRIFIWDLETGEVLGTPIALAEEVRAAAFCPDGKTIVAGAFQEPLYLLQLGGEDVVTTLRHESYASAVAFSPDGAILLSGTTNPLRLSGEVRLWDFQRARLLSPPIVQPHMVVAAAFSPDGTYFVIGTGHPKNGRGEARLYSRSGKLFGGPFSYERVALDVAVSPDSSMFATASMDGYARLYDRNGTLRQEIDHERKGVTSVAFSSNGRLLLTGDEDITARLWKIDKGIALERRFQHTSSVMGVAFSPNDRDIATACADRIARVWDSETGKVKQVLPHGDIVRSVHFSPDGRYVLTGSFDKRGRLWDVASGKLMRTPLRHDSWVPSAVFSPDGQWIATAGGMDKTIKVWRTSLSPIEGDPRKVLLWTELVTGWILKDDQTLQPLRYDDWLPRMAALKELGGPPVP